MRLPSDPGAVVSIAIRKCLHAVTLLLSIYILPLVNITISEPEDTSAMTFSIAIVPNIRGAIGPDRPTEAMSLALFELTLVELADGRDQDTLSVPLSKLVSVAFILVAICVNGETGPIPASGR